MATATLVNSYSPIQLNNIQHENISYNGDLDLDRSLVNFYSKFNEVFNPSNITKTSVIKKNKELLDLAYQKELDRIKNKNFSNIEYSKKLYNCYSPKIYELPFDKCSIEIIENEPLEYTLIFKDKYILIIELGLNDLENNEALYSFFINRKHVASDVVNFDEYINQFKNYINNVI